jgi:hypothetical protein
MIIKQHLFKPYKAMLGMCISKVETPEQVEVAAILLEDFKKKFTNVPSTDELMEALDDLGDLLQYRMDLLTKKE